MIHYRRLGERAIIGYAPDTGLFYRVYLKTTSHKLRLKTIKKRRDPRRRRARHLTRRAPIMVDYVNYQAARLAVYIMTGSLPSPLHIVTHLDGDAHNDRWDNLAVVPRRKPSRRQVSRWITREKVSPDECFYFANPVINGREYDLGWFDVKRDAILAIKKLHEQLTGVPVCNSLEKIMTAVPPERTKKRY